MSYGAKVLEIIADFAKPTAPLPGVSKKVHMYLRVSFFKLFKIDL